MHLTQLNREGCLQGLSWDRLVWSSRLVIPLKPDAHSQLLAGLVSCGTRRLVGLVRYRLNHPNLFRWVALCPKVLLSRRPSARWHSQILGLLQLALPEPLSERS